MNTKLADAMRAVILETGQSLATVANASRVDVAVLSRFLRGERSITFTVAERIINSLGCVVSITRPDPRAPLKTVPKPQRQLRARGKSVTKRRKKAP
jgi:transcriptional regulator with XRE-family HTH domain